MGKWCVLVLVLVLVLACVCVCVCAQCMYVNKQPPPLPPFHPRGCAAGVHEGHTRVRGRGPNRERSPHWRHAHRE